eukprot:125351-Prorocentrum_minimum.AAC.1
MCHEVRSWSVPEVSFGRVSGLNCRLWGVDSGLRGVDSWLTGGGSSAREGPRRRPRGGNCIAPTGPPLGGRSHGISPAPPAQRRLTIGPPACRRRRLIGPPARQRRLIGSIRQRRTTGTSPAPR